MITTRLTDYYYNLLHDIKAAKGRFSCFITHACKQLFIDVIEKYDHKHLLFVCKLSGTKIRVVLLVSENEAKVSPIESCYLALMLI